MNSGINILFYSRDCPTCKNLLSLLQNENLLGYFKLFCVDDRLNKLPIQIQMVPTMIVSNVNKPLVAQETFEWVQKIKFIRQKNMMDRNRRIVHQNLVQMANNNKNGPIGYKTTEMGSISDPFAFADIDRPMPQSFFGVGDEEKNVIFTAPEQGKIGKTDQEKMIKDMESKRGEQDQKYTQFMKQGQLKAVLTAEQEKLTQNNQSGMQSQQQANNQMMQQMLNAQMMNQMMKN